ncbi:MAG: response regulator transcription factor [Bryobacterales bacterium]|nr:response regulator transcription factor [Bryobacterales bacterium]
MIRVALMGPVGLARMGLETLLAQAEDIEVVRDGADVAVVFGRDWMEDEAPFVALVGDSDTAVEALREGARGVLSEHVSAADLAAAIRAVAAGLVVMPVEFVEGVVGRARAAKGDGEALTPREVEVLQWMGRGLSNKEIAARLGISDHTAKFHVASVMGKLGAGSRTEAVTEGLRQGLILL